ncbi:uncharacterized protein LOC122320716 [Drosophila ficusphila]|uniref:uncharacterized protein LOC122320716 n=1 Tax=Drosophila ficusphila TaxID=30025 RepID=UPI001C8A3E82|nr:uncharacterized protein LOC122320716 [Drosophila ficusphila]
MVPFVNTTGEGVFLKGGGINFMGKRANVLPNWETPLKLYTPVSSNVSVPLQHVQDTEIILFAKKYNLSLEIMGSEEDKLGGPDDQTPDIRLTSELSTRTEDLTNLNPFDLYSLMVMVPCSRRRSVHEIFAQLNLQSWAQYILPVYVAFVAVETFILVVNQRIYGHAYHVSLLNPLMNLRAFRGILGLSFPTGRRTSPSLRQLFLSISVFGVVFSNYFSCKLSAVLTMNSPHPQVENFKDLRESGLPTVVSHITRDYITREVDINFFNRTIPNTLSVDKMDHVIMTLSLNDSYAYIISSENWNFIKNYQHAFNRKVFCISNDLVITHGVPKKYVLGNNSLFDWPLSKFLLKVQEAGIATHWIKESPYLIRNDLNLTVRPNREFGNVPISVVDLKWLWFVLGFGYGLSTLVFIIELSMRRRETKNKTPKTRQDDSLA